MELYTILIHILHWFPGFVFISIVHGILVVVVEGPPQPRIIGAEEGRYPGGPPPPASVVDRAISAAVHAIYEII